MTAPARLLKRNEIAKEQIVYIETKKGDLIPCLINQVRDRIDPVYYAHFVTGLGEDRLFSWGTFGGGLYDGEGWRCWTSEPTQEQRKAAEWFEPKYTERAKRA